MKRSSVLLLVTLAMLVMAATVAAEVPNVISYQGRLTTPAGTPAPDASYTVVFTIYDAATSGASKWTETQSVTTSGGLFSVPLGSVAPISDTVFSGTTRYLGIKVGADPEMIPRITLVSVPYAHRVKTIDGATGGTISGSVGIGITTPNHTLDVAGDIGATQFRGPLVVNGGNITYAADGGNHIFTTATQERMRVTNSTGDAAIVLPTDAINSTEILNEPGLAANSYNGYHQISSTSWQEVVSVSITIPRAGYITLDGKAEGFFFAPGENNRIGLVQIAESPGGDNKGAYTVAFGFVEPPNNQEVYFPIYVTRTYYKEAGTFTFRIEAGTAYNLTGYMAIGRAMIRAVYVPTAYGAVATSTSTPTGTEGECAEASIGPDGRPMTVYVSDLRQLELKAAKVEAEAERLRRRVLEEKLKQQGVSDSK